MHWYFISFYGWVTSHGMDMLHLFTYSLAGGHLGCFHVLSVWNTSLWTFTHIFMLTYVYISCVYIPKSGVGRSHGNSIYNFLRNCQTVFKAMAMFSLPVVNLWGFWLLHILTFSCYLLSVRFSSLSGCDVVSHCGFDLHIFPWWQILRTFSFVYCLFVFLLWRNTCSNPSLAFKWIICFFTIELQECFVYSEHQGLIRYISYRYLNQIS